MSQVTIGGGDRATSRALADADELHRRRPCRTRRLRGSAAPARPRRRDPSAARRIGPEPARSPAATTVRRRAGLARALSGSTCGHCAGLTARGDGATTAGCSRTGGRGVLRQCPWDGDHAAYCRRRQASDTHRRSTPRVSPRSRDLTPPQPEPVSADSQLSYIARNCDRSENPEVECKQREQPVEENRGKPAGTVAGRGSGRRAAATSSSPRMAPPASSR